MKNFLLVLILTFPLLAFSESNAKSFMIERNAYYPKLDSATADELHTIKRNYYRYGNELKILADERIKKIKETTLDNTSIDKA